MELQDESLFLKDNKEKIYDGSMWDFPIEEIDYLLEEHPGESFAKINNRLYEMNI